MFPSTIVAIGLSAGGLQPLTVFFDNTPLDNTAYIVLAHLLPGYRSHLQNILSRHSGMDVIVATSEVLIEHNKVYVMPEDCYMDIVEGQLFLSPRLGKYPNTAIDIFFLSLAKNLESNIFAVIMSGTGTDGTIGIEFIKTAGGTVLVQKPSTCEHPDMANSAIASGNVDFVLSVEEMPRQIIYCNNASEKKRQALN